MSTEQLTADDVIFAEALERSRKSGFAGADIMNLLGRRMGLSAAADLAGEVVGALRALPEERQRDLEAALVRAARNPLTWSQYSISTLLSIARRLGGDAGKQLAEACQSVIPDAALSIASQLRLEVQLSRTLNSLNLEDA